MLLDKLLKLNKSFVLANKTMSFKKSVTTLRSAFIEKSRNEIGEGNAELLAILELHLDSYAQREFDYEELCLMIEELFASNNASLYHEFISNFGPNSSYPTVSMAAQKEITVIADRKIRANSCEKDKQYEYEPKGKRIKKSRLVCDTSLLPEATPEVNPSRLEKPASPNSAVFVSNLAPLNSVGNNSILSLLESLAMHGDSRNVLYSDRIDEAGMVLPISAFAAIWHRSEEGGYESLISFNADIENLFSNLNTSVDRSAFRARNYYLSLLSHYFPESLNRGRTRARGLKAICL